ncbi:TPA: hypothetical protein ACH3X1_005305 [Trebouxia sp. C0004]
MLARARSPHPIVSQTITVPACTTSSQYPKAPVAVPSMSARRLNQAIGRRLQKGPSLKEPVLGGSWTGLQKQSRSLHSASSAESAIQTPVQQVSQWWEQQWHQQQQQQQQPYTKQQPWRQQLHRLQPHSRPQSHQHQQQQQQQQQAPTHQLPVAARMAHAQRRPAQAVRPKRRKGSPRIVTSAKASSSAYGSPVSLEATSRFKSMLASGNRYRKMSTAAELLKQAHQLHSLQLQTSAPALQEPVHPSPCQQLQQQQHNLHKAFARQQQSAGLGSETGTAVSSYKSAAGQEQSHSKAVDHAAAAERDMASVALDVVESQLPQWSNRNTLDWSAQQELSIYQPQMQLKSASTGGLPVLTKLTIEERREQIEVQPLWVVVHQETPDGVARLYETVHTLYPEMLDHISDTVEPFCITDKNSMTFSKPQFSHGPWKGYLVGVVGDVAAHEDDALWPNRVRSVPSSVTSSQYQNGTPLEGCD